MLDIFAMFFTLGALLFETEKKAIKTGISKDNAIKEDKPYYWDGSKRRSTKTNEILILHDRKLIGVHSNRVYYDYSQQEADEFNKRGKECGSPVYLGRCKRHYVPKAKRYSEHRLREVETDRMYSVCTYPVVIKPGVIDKEHFRINYLDEDFKMTGESRILPKELRHYYEGF